MARSWSRFASLRIRVLIGVGVALVPGFALVGYLQADRRTDLLADARRSSEAQAQLVLAHQQDVVRAARQVLGVLASLPQLQSPTSDCNAELAGLLRAAPGYVQFGTAGLDGVVRCSALPAAASVDVGDRSWFRTTVSTGDFAVGDYQVGRITERPTVNFGYPIHDSNDVMVGVAFAAADLGVLIPEELGLFKGGEVLVVGSDDVVLASAKSPARVGTSVRGTELARTLRSAVGQDAVVGPGLAGVERRWIVTPLGQSSQGALVAAGVSTSIITAEADRLRNQGFALLAATLVVVGAGVWLLTDAVAIRPLRRLVATATRLRGGDLSARAGVRAAGEIGELARSLDEMANALEARDRRLRGQAELLDLASTMIYVCDLDGRITYWNAAAEHVYGWRSAEAVGASAQHLLASEHSPPRDEIMAALRHRGRWEGEARHRCRQGTDIVVTSSWALRAGDDDEPPAVLVVERDLSERKAFEDRLVHDATHDFLTGMPNRRAFIERLGRWLSGGQGAMPTLSLLVCGIDNFKVLNDSLGHDAGDGILVVVGERLAAASGGSPVYRLSGDVFATVHEGDGAEELARRLLESVRVPVEVYGRRFFLTLSIGIATTRGGDVIADHLLRQADIAMYQAKVAGRDRLECFEDHMLDGLLERVELEAELRHGIERGDLVLHYQPKVDLRTGAVVGTEALVRWQHPTRGLIHPDQFIALAEETGLILKLGAWSLREATRQARHWQQRSGRDLTVAVNVSTRQLRDPGLVNDVASALQDAGLAPSCLTLEITESALQESAGAARVLSQLDELGVRLSIDDFGTGYSSLDRLRRFPVHEVKIDKSFVQEIRLANDGAPLVVAMIAMAHSFGHRVVAEGIETPEQLRFLRAHGCDQAQGYLLGRPLPEDGFEHDHERRLIGS